MTRSGPAMPVRCTTFAISAIRQCLSRTPTDTLEMGMEMLEDSGTDFLPVVDWNERVLGVATRFAIVRAYEEALAMSDGVGANDDVSSDMIARGERYE